MHKYVLYILLVIVLVGSASAVQASSTHQVGYACDGGLIKVGDSSVDLMIKCGKPIDIEMRIAAVGIIQVWVYLNRYMSGNSTIMYVTINTLDKISHIKVIR